MTRLLLTHILVGFATMGAGVALALRVRAMRRERHEFDERKANGSGE